MKIQGPLISTEWLAENLESPLLRIYDATVFLHLNVHGPGYVPESGFQKWRDQHIPGAGFLDLLGTFADSSADVRFMMPAATTVAALAGELGIGDESQVVLYSAGSVMWSTRAWWMLRSIGFDSVGIVDGGLDKWNREARPLTHKITTYPPAILTPRPRPQLWADKEDVRKAIQDPAVCTINALSPEVYRGDKNMYGRAGHIPGSQNVFYNTLLDPLDCTFLAPDALRDCFAAVGALDRPRVIAYCGGGISATMDALALTLLGHPDVAVYDGSMMEWVADSELPLICGTHP